MFTTYLNFKGTCAEAFRFYERCFGGKIEFLQTFGDSPMKDSVRPDEHGLVMHVTLKVDGDTLMGSDARTPLGAGNISLVAGGLARRNTLGGDTGYGQFDRVWMTFGPPVPSLSPAGFAAAGVLVMLAAGFALRRRLARVSRE